MANVAIRLSVENAETVRQALLALGKDGEKALKQLQVAGTSQGSGGLKALSSLVDEAKNRLMGLAVSIGPAGSAMIQLGPAGLAAAAAIGLIGNALNSARERAEQFATWARQVREGAERIGATTDEFQALTYAAERSGLSSDQATRFFDKLTLSVAQLREGGGPLFDALVRINSGLVTEVAAAGSTTQALNVLRQAYQGLTDAGQRARLATAIGGEGGQQAGRLLGTLGDTPEEIERAQRARRIASSEFLHSAEAQWQALQRSAEASSRIWSNLLGPPALGAAQALADIWLGISRAVETAANAGQRLAQAHADAQVGEAGNLALGSQRRPGQQPGGQRPLTAGQDILVPQSDFAPSAASSALASQLSVMRLWTSLLSDALTPSEQLTQRTLELDLALSRGHLTQEQYNRALRAFARAQDSASTATRQRIGIVSQEEVLATRMRDLDDLQSKGFIRNAEERAQAERIVQREIRETMEALRVRASETPALTRLAIDADNLTKNLDQNLAGALRGTTTTILEMAKGTKTLSQGFGELAERIAEAIAQALLMKMIVGPAANALAGAFGVTGSAYGNVFDRGRVTPFARGGIVTTPTIFPMANGLGLMGEAGPEAVMPLRRLSSGRLGVEAAGGGGNMLVQIINNHSGARVSQREESDGRGGRR